MQPVSLPQPVVQSVRQVCIRVLDIVRGQAGTAPAQKETLHQTLSTGSLPNSGGGQQSIIYIYKNQKPASIYVNLAALGARWWQNFIPEGYRMVIWSVPSYQQSVKEEERQKLWLSLGDEVPW